MEETGLVGNQDREFINLQTTLEVLSSRYAHYQQNVGGLKDLDLTLELIRTKLELALGLVGRRRKADPAGQAACFSEARRQANEALNLYEELARENISLDQSSIVQDSSVMEEIRVKLQALLLAGGAGFFEQRLARGKQGRLVARTIQKAILKFQSPDDRYEPVYKTEQLPRWLRRIVLYFLPVFAKEYQQDPPYGIEEGEPEELYHSSKIKMPLSQAIYYLEEELLPDLAAQLAARPGDPLLQQRSKVAREKLEEFKGIDLLPRSRPFVQEKGYYTDAFAHYTQEGELLVSMALPVSYRSGTNLDRMQYHVKNEIVKNLAGKGVCPELDAEYLRLKGLESGRQGSSRMPGLRINTERWFIPLKKYVPLLQLIEDKQEFGKLIDKVSRQDKRQALIFLEDQMGALRRRLL